jgi:hypothetical protein
MTSTFTRIAVVQPGGVIEVREPALPEGRTVRVTVELDEGDGRQGSLLRFLGAAPGLFATPAEVDASIDAERDAWE